MLTLFISIIGILITISLVVGVHELGHFLAARSVGIKVLRFSIGFGKPLLRWQGKRGTEYVLAAIPLGGYVKMLDEEEGNVPVNELPYAFNRQPIYKKLWVVIAGPLFNLIFAFIIYWALFMIGFTSIVPILGNIPPDSIAANAGLKPNTEIISINSTPTRSWMAVVIHIISQSGEKNTMLIETKNPINQKTQEHKLDLSNWKIDNLKPEPLESLGLAPYQPVIPPVIGEIQPNSSAEQNGLKKADVILSVNKKAIKNWDDLFAQINSNPKKNLLFTIKRDGKIQKINVRIDYTRDFFFKKHGYLGISPNFKWPEAMLRKNQYGPIQALSHAWQNTADFTQLNFIVLGKLLTGKISLQSLGGPITIFSGAGSALNQGLIPFLSFLAFLSISIGIINIVPIPGLDGGHILFFLIAAITRRPLSPRLQSLLYRLGFIALILLMVQALINDLLRL